MSALAPGTPEANAKQIRALSQALGSLHKTSNIWNVSSILIQCEASQALATVSANDASDLYSAIRSAMSNAHSDARTAALRATILTAQSSAPYILAEHWTSLSHQVASLLKSVTGANSGLTAQALTAMSTLVVAGAPLALKGGEDKTKVSTVCHSAVSHAIRILDCKTPTAAVPLAAMALLFAVLFTAPRELRQCLTRLEAALWARWLDHPVQRVRSAAAKLLAHLLVCCPNKVKQKVFDERIQSICQQFDEILVLLDLFAPGNDAHNLHPSRLRTSAPRVTSKVSSLSADQLNRRYSALSELLQHILKQSCSVPLVLPLPMLLHTICSGNMERQIDPYATGVEGVVLSADSAIGVLAVVRKESLSTLVVLIDSAQRGAILPYTQLVARTFQRLLSHVVLRARTKHGAIACITERMDLYRALVRLIHVLGSGFLERIVHLFAELFDGDVKLYTSAKETEELLLQHRASVFTESVRSRKRRRSSYASGHEKATKEASIGPTDTGSSVAKTLGGNASSDVERVLTAGVEVANVIFENRGLPTPPAMVSLERLEAALTHLSSFCSESTCLLEAFRAVALGGGSSRLQGESSPLLLRCTLLSKDALLRGNSSCEVRRVAFRARSSCESVLHPRGPPVLRALLRTRDQSFSNKKDNVRSSPVLEERISRVSDVNDMPPLKSDSLVLNGNPKASLPPPQAGLNGELAQCFEKNDLNDTAPSDPGQATDPIVTSGYQEENVPVKKTEDTDVGLVQGASSEPMRTMSMKVPEKRRLDPHTEVGDQQLPLPHPTLDENVLNDDMNIPNVKGAPPLAASLHNVSDGPVDMDTNPTVAEIEEIEPKQATSQKRRLEKDMEGMESEEDEEALIASLRFEQSDEE